MLTASGRVSKKLDASNPLMIPAELVSMEGNAVVMLIGRAESAQSRLLIHIEPDRK